MTYRLMKSRSHEEMPEKSSSVNLLFKVNQDILDLRNGYSPIKLQDALDDYFHFGFSLGITFVICWKDCKKT